MEKDDQIKIDKEQYRKLLNETINQAFSDSKKKIFNIITEDGYNGNHNDYCFFKMFFSSFIKVPTLKIPTAAVTMLDKGIILLYNPFFINSLSDLEIRFIICHEVLHIVHDHISRLNFRDMKLFNIATDACINDIIISSCISKNILENGMPLFEYVKKPEGLVMFDEKYDGKKISEDYYDWLLKDENKDVLDKIKEKYFDKPNNNEDDDEDGGSDGSGCDCEGDEDGDYKGSRSSKKNGERKLIDEHDINIDDFADELKEVGVKEYKEMSPTEKKEFVDRVISEAKSRGYVSGDLQTGLDSLKKTKKNYIKDIVSSVTEMIGKKKHRSYKRENRYGFEGLKGNVRYSNCINVLLDTSGSMCGEFEKALSVLFNRDVVCNLIQCDTVVHGMSKISTKHELQKLKISGLGGTEIQPAVDYVSNNKELLKLNTLILTDGYCDSLNIDKIPGKVLVISTGVRVKFIGRKKGKNILIDNTIYE